MTAVYMASGLLLLAPALALALALWFGHYPGEEMLVRERHARPWRRRRRERPRRRTSLLQHAAGGEVIARSLAGRAPPSFRLVNP
jgi:glyoxylase-like metal-dependent hydrolase (beta-lactamase superfamily II)